MDAYSLSCRDIILTTFLLSSLHLLPQSISFSSLLYKKYIYISKNDKENSKNQTKRKGKDFSMFESLSVPLLRVVKLLVAFAFRKGTFRYHFDSRCCFSHFSMSLSRFLLLPPACFFLFIRRKEPPLFLMHAWSSAYIGVKIPSSLAVKPAMCVWTLDPRYS